MGGQYHIGLVVLSVLIAILASYTALDLATSVSIVRGRARAIWLVVGSLAMGTGIWSMHFIGMLAFHLPNVIIAYEIRLVILSVVVAIIASALALITLTRPTIATSTLVLAGLSMGVAIAGMHYTGMAGMRAPAVVRWNGWVVIASIAIAVAASFVALHLAVRVRDTDRKRARALKLGGATIMGFAIAGMHYTAMAAAHFIAQPRAMRMPGEYVVATSALAVAVVGTTILILFIAIGASFVTRELTRRAELTARVRESEEYYRALIETASDLIVVVDANAIRMYVSPSYARVLGYAPESLLGKSAFDFVHPEDLPKAQGEFGELTAAPNAYASAEFRVRHAEGGWRNLRIIGHNLLMNPAVRGVVMTATDETDRLHLEMQFQQSQKMEAIGKLAGGVAHDFNNLLTVILGNLEILITEPPPADELHSDLKDIRTAAQRAATLTRQLLAFSRRQMMQPRIIDLNDTVRGMQGMLARLLGEDVEMLSDLQEELWCVSADPGQVEQALMNLAVNARDAMPDGGALEFSSRNITNPGPTPLSPEPIPSGDYVCIAVRDDGSGIDPDTMSRMFEPFFTTKDVGKGTGLGLATVYGIMKQSGGYIGARSEMGKGTTFELYFPRSDYGVLTARANSSRIKL